jgi:3-oxoadipate CoA-transferase alpha subunit
MHKVFNTYDEAVFDAFDGAVVTIGGFFSEFDIPINLVEALRRQGATNLTIVNNGAGNGDYAIGGLIKDGRVRKLVSSFPNTPGAWAFRERYLANEIELELVPQGTLAERIRAGGAGLGGFFTRTGAGTEVAKGKEVRVIDGQEYIFEKPIYADFALIKAQKGDSFGNLCYRGTMRNFNMVMATAAKVVVAEVDEIVPVGALSPEEIHTPGIFVDRIVLTAPDHAADTAQEKKVNSR